MIMIATLLCRVQLQGLSKARLNGRRGAIQNVVRTDAGRWNVRLDGSPEEPDAEVVAVNASKATSLLECAECGKADVAKKLRTCSQCLGAFYCDRVCQKKHWKEGGHKHMCKAPACCTICLDNDVSDGLPPMQGGCACRGDAAWSHISCKIKVAESMHGRDNVWSACLTCTQAYTGPMWLGLTHARWEHARLLPKDHPGQPRADRIDALHALVCLGTAG